LKLERVAELRVGGLIVLALAAISAAVTASPILVSGQLPHDTLGVYAYFFDNFDSLYRFGEPAWWSPELGFPTTRASTARSSASS
jgi:hypothetical protein